MVRKGAFGGHVVASKEIGRFSVEIDILYGLYVTDNRTNAIYICNLYHEYDDLDNNRQQRKYMKKIDYLYNRLNNEDIIKRYIVKGRFEVV